MNARIVLSAAGIVALLIAGCGEPSPRVRHQIVEAHPGVVDTVEPCGQGKVKVKLTQDESKGQAEVFCGEAEWQELNVHPGDRLMVKTVLERCSKPHNSSSDDGAAAALIFQSVQTVTSAGSSPPPPPSSPFGR